MLECNFFLQVQVWLELQAGVHGPRVPSFCFQCLEAPGTGLELCWANLVAASDG